MSDAPGTVIGPADGLNIDEDELKSLMAGEKLMPKKRAPAAGEAPVGRSFLSADEGVVSKSPTYRRSYMR